MALCPLCNGLRTISIACHECGKNMDDKGKAMDYDDEYSAYMDIDTLKENDGYKTSLKNGECPHLMYCPECKKEEVVLIKE